MGDETHDEQQLGLLLDYLRRVRGFDFAGYKRGSLVRRIGRRMSAVGIDDYAAYVDYLEVHPDEFVALFNTVLINVTGFFRDPAIWDYLVDSALPKLLGAKAPDAPIRVWSAGCASGEEPYTLAMVLVRLLGAEAVRDRVKIYATDVDDDALATARAATYPERAMSSVPADYVDEHFQRTDDGYVFSKDLRRSVIFGRHDLVQDAPISRIDVLVCRNTLIYLNTETQARVLNRFNFALNDEGLLVLGKAEMLLAHTSVFTPADLRRRIFCKSTATTGRRKPAASGTAAAYDDSAVLAAEALRALLLESSPVAQLALDADGKLAFMNERCASLFDLTPRDVGRPFQDLDVSYRPIELRGHLDRARSERRPIRVRDAEWSRPGGEHIFVDVQLVPLLDEDAVLRGVAVSFVDVTRYHELQREVEHANLELGTAYEELQSTNEELETTNEELQSTVEELETTNEELQSTNEELETMNEELQSLNDELQSINDLLRGRTADLNAVNSYLESILGSMDSGVAVVDRELRIRIWNRQAEELWGVRSDEVVAEPLLMLDIGLPVDQLGPPVRAAITDGKSSDVRLHATNRRGREVECRIKVTPLGNGAGADPAGAIVLMAAD